MGWERKLVSIFFITDTVGGYFMKYIAKTEEAFIGLSILAVTVVLFLNIILRFFFNSSTTWAEEFIRYVMIWITFIGSAVCFRRGIHVGIDLLMEFLPFKGKRNLQFIINGLSIVFMILLIKFGVDLVLFSMQTGQISASLQLKTYWVYLAVPVGAGLSLLHLTVNTVSMIKNPEEPIQE